VVAGGVLLLELVGYHTPVGWMVFTHSLHFLFNVFNFPSQFLLQHVLLNATLTYLRLFSASHCVLGGLAVQNLQVLVGELLVPAQVFVGMLYLQFKVKCICSCQI